MWGHFPQEEQLLGWARGSQRWLHSLCPGLEQGWLESALMAGSRAPGLPRLCLCPVLAHWAYEWLVGRNSWILGLSARWLLLCWGVGAWEEQRS